MHSNRSSVFASLRGALLPLVLLAANPTAVEARSRAADAADSAGPTSEDGMPRRLVLALDGIPFDVFTELQAEGHFRQFHPASRMVSTFPSLSEVAFAAIGGGEPPEGYQFVRYDPARNRVVGTTIASLNGRAHPKLVVDSSGDSIPHRVMGYVASYRTAIRDLRQIESELLASKKHDFVAYLGTSDPLVHLQGREGTRRFLVWLDAYLVELQQKTLRKTGRYLLVDLVSDHGSTLVRGKVVALERELAKCGLRRSRSLAGPGDVVYPKPGIVGAVALVMAPTDADSVARCFARVQGVDLVAVDHGETIAVINREGEADVRLIGGGLQESYGYRVKSGDPLGLLAPATASNVAADGELRWSASQWFDATKDGARPDPLRRLWRAFHGSVKHPSKVLVSLSDGYEIGNPALLALSSLRGRFGTHGSMTRMASLGVIASNWREIPDVDAWGANEVLFGEAVLARSRLDADSISGWTIPRSFPSATSARPTPPASRH